MTETAKSPLTLLRVDTSVRRADSVTRSLSDQFVKDIVARTGATVMTHDLAKGLPLIDEEWVGANFTAEEDRTDDQKQKLSLSDTLIADLKAADVIVFGLPVYNFGVPAALKAWVDLVARARVTFQYSEAGPEGLLKGKKAYLLVASGGTPVGSGYDYATTYMKHVLGFIGITDVSVVAADQMAVDADASLAKANGELAGAVAEFPKAA